MLRNWCFLVRKLPRAKILAKKHFAAAVRVWRVHPAPSLLAWALCGLAEIAASRGEDSEVRTYCKEAIELAESVDAFSTVERARMTLAKI